MQIFKDIQIGELAKDRLIQKLVDEGVHFNDYAKLLFEQTAFANPPSPLRLSLVKVSFAELEIQGPCSYATILEQATRRGLEPCPLITAAYLRLEYREQIAGPYLTVASPPLGAEITFPTGLYLRNHENKLWLRGYRVEGEPEWPKDNEFVFTSRGAS